MEATDEFGISVGRIPYVYNFGVNESVTNDPSQSQGGFVLFVGVGYVGNSNASAALTTPWNTVANFGSAGYQMLFGGVVDVINAE